MPELADLATRLRDFATARDWERFHTPKNLLMALAGEVGELVAELQWLSEPEADPRRWNEALHERVSDEIADVMIYLVRFADICDVDLLAAANEKITRNENRFPPSSAAPVANSGGGPDASAGGAALPDDPEGPLECSPRPDGHRA